MVRVSDELFAELVKTQKDERTPDGNEPKYAELLDRIWKASGGMPANSDPTINLNAADRELVKTFAGLLQSGSQLRDIILPALGMYIDEQKRKATQPVVDVAAENRRKKAS
jgi:hypothetical protein